MTSPIESNAKINAAMGFAVLTAGFVCEPETFPVFLAWAANHKGGALDPGFTREKALELHDELIHGMHAVDLMTRLAGQS